MLKSCWDCLIGSTREQVDNEVVYGTQLNGNSTSVRAPPWPEPREDNEIMFLLPRKLSTGDSVNLTGTLRSTRKLLAISLITGNNSPDYRNIACQFEAVFPNESSDEDKIAIKIVREGVEEIIQGDHEENTATDIFQDSNFTFGFSIRVVNYDTPIVDIYIGGSFIQQFRLKHYLSDIRYLTVNGDIERVDKLDFQFG